MSKMLAYVVPISIALVVASVSSAVERSSNTTNTTSTTNSSAIVSTATTTTTNVSTTSNASAIVSSATATTTNVSTTTNCSTSVSIATATTTNVSTTTNASSSSITTTTTAINASSTPNASTSISTTTATTSNISTTNASATRSNSFGRIEVPLNCQQSEVLSAEAFNSFAERGVWFYDPAALVLWVLIFLLFTSCLLSGFYDQEMQYEDLWRPEYFMVTDVAYSGKQFGHAADAELAKLRTQGRSGCLKVMRVKLACMNVRLCLAQLRRFSGTDLRLVLIGLRDRGLDNENSHDDHNLNKISTPLRELAISLQLVEGLEHTLHMFESASFGSKALSAFAGFHPWFSLCYYSITTPYSLRALLLADELLGMLMLIALYLTIIDTLLTWRSDAACDSGNCSSFVLQACLLGSGCFLLARLHVCLALRLRRRRFMYSATWVRVALIKKIVNRWKMRDLLICFCGCCHCVFCIIYLMTFLADVHEDGLCKWRVSASWALFLDLFIMPAAMAGVVAGSSCIRRKDSDLFHHVRQQFAIYSAASPPAEADCDESLPDIFVDDDDLHLHDTGIAFDPTTHEYDTLYPMDCSLQALAEESAEDSDVVRTEEQHPDDASCASAHGEGFASSYTPSFPVQVTAAPEDDMCEEPPMLLVYAGSAVRGCHTCTTEVVSCTSDAIYTTYGPNCLRVDGDTEHGAKWVSQCKLEVAWAPEDQRGIEVDTKEQPITTEPGEKTTRFVL